MNNPFAGLDNIAPEPSAPQPPAPQQPGQSEERWKPSPPETPPSQSRRWLWWAAGGVIVLGLAGGGYFAYSQGYLPIPFLTPKTDALFDKMVASITDIKTAQYSARVKLTGQPRSGKATSIFPKKTNANDNTNAINEVNLNSNTNGSFQIEPIGSQLGLGEPSPGYLGVLLALADPKEILQGIPADVKFDGGITLAIEADKSAAEANGSVRLDGAYTGGDLTVAIDLEARKKNKDLYAIVNKFPSIFIDPSAIKGKWIKITTEDNSFVTDETYEQFNTKQAIEAMKTGLATALKEKVVTVKQKLPAETVAGVKSEHYLISLNPDALTKMYEKLRDEKRGKGESTALYDDMLKALQKPETTDQLKRIVDNTRVEVWVDRVQGYLRQITWALTIVPPEGNERLKDKQFLAEFTLTLERVNEKITVDVPSSTIDLDEATRLITGITKEEQQAQKQLDRVSAALSALRQYKDAQKAYPDSLETLSTHITEAKAACKANEPTGTARERARDAKRKSDLRQISLMLREYSDANSRFPTSLAEVNTNENLGTIPKDPESNQDYGYTACENNQGFVLTTTLEAYNNGKLYSLDSTGNTKLGEKLTCTASLTGPLQRVPSTESSCSTLKYSAKKFNTTDLYTNKTFGYALADNDYRLTYQVKLDDIKESYTKEAYADGTNTATSTDQSIEKETSYEKSQRERPVNANVNTSPIISPDTDGDGINDAAERDTYKTDPIKADTDEDGLLDYEEIFKYKTDPKKADSDGDGFDDQTETINGFNPIGTGQATQEQLQVWGKSPSQTGGPLITNVTVSSSAGSATVKWTTNTASDGIVNFGETNGYGTFVNNYDFITSHSINLSVTTGKTYHYAIRSCTPSPNSLCTTTPDQTFIAQ